MAVPTSGRWGTFARVSTETTSSAARPATDIDHIADDFLARFVELSPITATYLGITGHDEELDDFSPAGHEAHAALRAETLAQLDRATPVDDIDRVTLAAMRERLGRGRGDPPGRARRDGAQRDRVTAAVDPRLLRPDAHRDRRGLGHPQPPARARARGPLRLAGEPAQCLREGPHRPAPPGRGLHPAVRRPGRRRRLLRHPRRGRPAQPGHRPRRARRVDQGRP